MDSHDIMQQPVILPQSMWMQKRRTKIQTKKELNVYLGPQWPLRGESMRENWSPLFSWIKNCRFWFSLLHQNWEELKDSMHTTQMVDTFVTNSSQLVDNLFPLKETKRYGSLPWPTSSSCRGLRPSGKKMSLLCCLGPFLAIFGAQ